MRKLLRMIFLLSVFCVLFGCEQIALMTTPAKKPMKSNTQLAALAEKNFWETLHQGHYANLPQVITQLTAAYLKNPDDPTLAAYLGFAHIWKIAERNREQNIPPVIVDEMILAKKYFFDAVQLNPADARLQGFLGVSQLATGKIFQNEREQVRGYFQLQHAIAMWPEFNYFTAGYPMSDLNPKEKQFQEGLDWQWKTLDLCAGKKIDRNHPDFAPYLSRDTNVGSKRACWNSWIAPHNFEGFFLNMGDMLVKAGQWQTAIQIYQNAKLSKQYTRWPYRSLLENRIQHAKSNVIYFQKQDERDPDKMILFNSGRGCMACHQTSS